MKNKTFLFYLAGVLVLSLGFFFLGYFVGSSSINKEKKSFEIKNEKELREIAKKELLDYLRKLDLVPPPPEIVSNITGKIVAKGENFLIVETDLEVWDPFRELLPARVKVIVDKDTKIIELVPKELQIFEKEQEEFKRKIKLKKKSAFPPESFLTPPSPFKEKEITLAQLEKGTPVFIESSENIIGKSSFKATKIQIQPEAFPK